MMNIKKDIVLAGNNLTTLIGTSCQDLKRTILDEIKVSNHWKKLSRNTILTMKRLWTCWMDLNQNKVINYKTMRRGMIDTRD